MRFETATLEQLAVAYQESRDEPIGQEVFYHLVHRLEKLIQREVIHKPYYRNTEEYRQDCRIIIWQCVLGYSPLAGGLLPYITVSLNNFRKNENKCPILGRFGLLSSRGVDSLDRATYPDGDVCLGDTIADTKPGVVTEVLGRALVATLSSRLNQKQQAVFGMIMGNNGKADIGGMAESFGTGHDAMRKYVWRLRLKMQDVYARLEAS